jgi:mRNA interferase MazF
MARSSFPQRGEIWLVNLDPTVEREIRKTRPCVIIQNDIGNQYAPTTIVAPLSSTPYTSPVVVPVSSSATNGLANTSYLNLAQIRCVNKTRLVKQWGALSSEEVRLMESALKKSLGL